MVSSVTVPPSTKPPYSDHDIASAYHEAGHVVVIIHEDFSFLSKPVTIRDSDGGATTPWSAGDILQRARAAPTARARYEILKPKLLVDFAGGYAEVKKTGRGAAANDGVHDDMRRSAEAFSYAVTPYSEEQRRAWTAEADQSARALIDRLWPAVSAIAEALLHHSQLSQVEAKRIYVAALNPAPSAPKVDLPLAPASPAHRSFRALLVRFLGRW